MKKLLAVLLLLVGTASSGCIFVDDDPGRPRHVHCIGCGHVYVKGAWR